MDSQGDLTEEADSNNLYVNPLEGAEKCGNSRVKKSVSGEVGRNVSDASPSVESLKDIRPYNEGGKVTLNDTVPKHRKIRIQQVSPLAPAQHPPPPPTPPHPPRPARFPSAPRRCIFSIVNRCTRVRETFQRSFYPWNTERAKLLYV